MKFLYLNYFPLFLAGIFFLSLMVRKREKTFFSWVEKHWFYKKSKWRACSNVLLFISLTLAGLALLDLRGPEIKTKAEVPEQRTILLIDTSASMLVEDIRPNRFQKATLIAKHFIKNAVGHQISVVLFSDIQKKLVPFTDDLDLLEARIGALEDTSITKGGSNLYQAIQDSVQYFLEGSADKGAVGNIVVLTDSEDTYESFQLKVPDEITVAVVGIGTLKGGPVPVRDREGRLLHYKKYSGDVVTSKLNERILKELGNKIKNYKYWIASSYALPTEEILAFLRGNHQKKFERGDIRIMPVYMEYLMIPSILIFIVAMLLRVKNSFTIPVGLIVFFLGVNSSVSFSKNDEALRSEKIKISQEEEEKLKEKRDKLIERIKKGKADFEDKVDLANLFIQLNQKDEAMTLYKESVEKIKPGKKKQESLFNFGTALLEKGKLTEGLSILRDLEGQLNDDDPDDRDMKEMIRKNIYFVFKNQQKNKDKNKQDNKGGQNNQGSGENNEKQDKNQGQGQQNRHSNVGQGDNQNQGQNQNNMSSERNENQPEKNSSKQNGEKANQSEEQENKNQNGEQADKRDENKEDGESEEDKEKEKQISQLNQQNDKDKRPKKVPALLKQLMSDDRQIQEKVLDTSTNKRDHENRIKDW